MSHGRLISVSERWRPQAIVLLALMVAATGWAGADDYRLGVDDVIAIRVLYHPDFSVEAATVRPDGKVNVPVAGDVEVAGRTVIEVADVIAAALAEELRDPEVSVRLVRRQIDPVYVVGAVGSPGAVSVREAVTVAEAIALAGGISPSAAPHYGVIIGRDGQERRIDVLAALGHDPDFAGETIKPGETLVVSAQFLVSVVGQVRQPGRYPVEEGDRVADALAAAGGLAPDAAAAGHLVRADGAAAELDLEGIVARGTPESNLPLRPGDLIVVPEVARTLTLVGAFEAPGKYAFDAGDRVSDAVALARGTSDDAHLSAGLLVSSDGRSQPIDLEALLQGGEGAEDPELGDGDTIILPRKTDRVAVVGMVVRPGVIDFEPGMTLMDALGAAGGWTQEKSRPHETVLWRPGPGGPAMTPVDASGLLKGDEGAGPNPDLQPGDIIYVPADERMTRDELSRLLLGISGLLRIAF